MSARPTGQVHYDNQGRVVLVSGGANGIGRSVCELFYRSGAHVVCMDVDQEKARGLPPEVEFFAGDTSIEDHCQKAVAHAVSTFGGLDVLVNNAAIQPPDSYVRLDLLTAEAWNRMLEVNLSGYTYLGKHAARIMRQQQHGVIINLASGQAHRTARQVPCYGPIKAANVLQAIPDNLPSFRSTMDPPSNV
ncbi:MAG: SDR family oxidoreductase [bacterium]|nr:SDR family oxidoreductase [bacterium]